MNTSAKLIATAATMWLVGFFALAIAHINAEREQAAALKDIAYTLDREQRQ
jgi:hypothetical protein